MTVRRILEDIGPLIFAIIITAILALYVSQLTGKENEDLLKDFATFSLGVSTAIGGFLLTVFTIIHSINTKRMVLLRQNGVYARLISFLNSSIVSHGFVVIASLIVILPYVKTTRYSFSINEYPLYINLWMGYAFLTFFAVALSYRFISIFLHTLSDETNFSR